MAQPYAGDYRVTSPYGTRADPFTGETSNHKGIDLVGDGDKVIRAVSDGVVVQSRIVTDTSNATWQWGEYIAIRDDDGYIAYYAHLSQRYVESGASVKAGEPIGLEGSTGRSTGSHLHFEVRIGSRNTDPMAYIDNATPAADGSADAPAGIVTVYDPFAITTNAEQAAPTGAPITGDLRLTANGTDITPAVTALALDSSLATLGDCLKFAVPWSDLARYNIAPIGLGQTVRLTSGGTQVFQGIVTSREHTETARAYTAYDFCYYLNKSKLFIQFDEGVPVYQAIAKMWDTLGVTRINLPRMMTPVSVEKMTYFTETPAQILKKLLAIETNVTGVEYYAYANNYGGVDIEPVGYYETQIPDLRTMSAPRYQQTLDDMRNSVQVVVGNVNDLTDPLGGAIEDGLSIRTYGMVREVITLDEDEAQFAEAIARKTLSRRHFPLDGGNVTVLGDWRILRGRRLKIREPVVGFNNTFVVRSVTHIVDPAVPLHTMTMTVEEYNNG